MGLFQAKVFKASEGIRLSPLASGPGPAHRYRLSEESRPAEGSTRLPHSHDHPVFGALTLQRDDRAIQPPAVE